MITRLPNWRVRLDDYLDSIDGAPFEWGVLDCSLFASGCIEAMTGVDLAAETRGTYNDARSAARVAISLGFRDHVEFMAANVPEIHPAEAGLGDIAAVRTEDGFALALFNKQNLICMTRAGRGVLPRSDAYRAFRI
jgi:hypothetical protein